MFQGNVPTYPPGSSDNLPAPCRRRSLISEEPVEIQVKQFQRNWGHPQKELNTANTIGFETFSAYLF